MEGYGSGVRIWMWRGEILAGPYGGVVEGFSLVDGALLGAGGLEANGR